VGVAQRIELVQQVVPPERMSGVAPLVHVHQQFLNQAVDHGLPGLVGALLSAAAPFALAWRARPNVMRWQFLGIGVVHGTGLLFNANMTHGPYAFNVALSLLAVLLMHQNDGPEST
jgi:O-antigen ligase